MCRDGVIGGQNLIVGLVLLGDGRINRYDVAHELGDPEAIRILPAPDVGAATLAARTPEQVALRTFIVR